MSVSGRIHIRLVTRYKAVVISFLALPKWINCDWNVDWKAQINKDQINWFKWVHKFRCSICSLVRSLCTCPVLFLTHAYSTHKMCTFGFWSQCHCLASLQWFTCLSANVTWDDSVCRRFIQRNWFRLLFALSWLVNVGQKKRKGRTKTTLFWSFSRGQRAQYLSTGGHAEAWSLDRFQLQEDFHSGRKHQSCVHRLPRTSPWRL